MQAYSARLAERNANVQAQERHISEQKRQREHEQMLEQISRINRCATSEPSAMAVARIVCVDEWDNVVQMVG
eukprot:SAG31_NODE_4972_length_2825_cov_2.318782_4_plen_72_part_00